MTKKNSLRWNADPIMVFSFLKYRQIESVVEVGFLD